MTRTEVGEKIRELLAREFKLDAALLVEGATLRGSLGMHSIQLVSLAVLLEETFPEVEASGDDFDRYATLASVGDVIDFVHERVGAR
ncbi:MAG: acyl carrier protein [Candidatus Wallbacteria bacterium]|nr:acyl carrier protein [Candidatus Wallbacteria bacterium]MBI4868646.1 acyl carrier protein [Candidatus Wallbacteria bacterium]